VQMWVMMYGLYKLQQLATGMNFHLSWLGGVGKLFTLMFPILFFMGDTPAHDKLCCLQIHPGVKYICWMCNIHKDNLDQPREPYVLQNMHMMNRLLREEKYGVIKEMGYYPCKGNILLYLQYCNLYGLNQAVPPENLHVILIGCFMHLIQGLSHSHKITGRMAAEQALEVKGSHYVFSSDNRNMVQTELNEIGFQLTWQSDPDLPRTKFSEYLIDLASKDSSTGNKQAHEMRGVLLTFCFI